MLYYRERESNRKHYFRIAALVALILVSAFVPGFRKATSNVVLTVMKPVNQVTSLVTNEFQDFIDSVFGTKPNRDLVKKLQTENNDLKNQMNKLQIIINEEEILKKESEISKDLNQTLAKVIALDDKSTFNKFIINKGSKDGLKKDDIVVGAYLYKDGNSQGALIGKLEEVHESTSKVVSIMDDKFNLTFMDKKSNKFGVINSRTSGFLEGYMLDKNTPISKDDVVVTSGIGGVYHKGILIGNVVDVTESTDELSKLVRIESPIDFKRIFNVFVIPNEGVANE